MSVEWTEGNALGDLSDEEKRLVCGDPHPEAANQGDLRFDDAWKQIPFPQARYNLRNFLADRGYFHPELVQAGEHELVVRVGEPTTIRSLTVEDLPSGLKPYRKRDFLGRRLTSSALDGIEKWISQRVQALGYPCPKIQSRADPETGAVQVTIWRGPLQNFIAIEEESIPGTQAGMLRRYDAFHLGDVFDGDLLTVSENRVNNTKLVESDHLSASCGPQGALVKQSTTVGPPRLISLGAGINTEGVLVGKATWRDVRLGSHASSIDVTAEASSIEQFVSAYFNWYTLPYPSRRYLVPKIVFDHENQQWYETYTETPWMGWGTTWDGAGVGLSAVTGPSLELIRMISGYGPGVSHFSSWRSEVSLRSHGFEYWQSSPRAGFDTKLVTRFNSGDVYSTASAQALSLSGEALFNYRELDPPLIVLGVRGTVATTVTGEQLGPGTMIPPNFRYYLGGSPDLRGFGLQEIPGPNGGLTSVYLGIEARLVATLPIGLEPIAFVDTGVMGAGSWQLDDPFYWSPGGGIRWASPFGPIRTTLAHGFINGTSDHWQFFLSLGEEF